jgi:hypothetical protein
MIHNSLSYSRNKKKQFSGPPGRTQVHTPHHVRTWVTYKTAHHRPITQAANRPATEEMAAAVTGTHHAGNCVPCCGRSIHGVMSSAASAETSHGCRRQLKSARWSRRSCGGGPQRRTRTSWRWTAEAPSWRLVLGSRMAT